MAKKTWVIASEEGAARYGAEVDEVVELDIPHREEVAVVAAGWLKPKTSRGKGG